jgi:hypothetical protein
VWSPLTRPLRGPAEFRERKKNLLHSPTIMEVAAVHGNRTIFATYVYNWWYSLVFTLRLNIVAWKGLKHIVSIFLLNWSVLTEKSICLVTILYFLTGITWIVWHQRPNRAKTRLRDSNDGSGGTNECKPQLIFFNKPNNCNVRSTVWKCVVGTN